MQIRRPHDFDFRAAAALGPLEPAPYVDPGALEVVSTQVAEGPDKLYVGGLAHFMHEKEVRPVDR